MGRMARGPAALKARHEKGPVHPKGNTGPALVKRHEVTKTLVTHTGHKTANHLPYQPHTTTDTCRAMSHTGAAYTWQTHTSRIRRVLRQHHTLWQYLLHARTPKTPDSLKNGHTCASFSSRSIFFALYAEIDSTQRVRRTAVGCKKSSQPQPLGAHPQDHQNGRRKNVMPKR